jgi:hypothetical protein
VTDPLEDLVAAHASGKLIFTILPVLLVVTVGLIAVLVLFGPTILQFLGDNLWLVRFVVAATRSC